MTQKEKKAIEYLKKTVDFWKRNNIKDRYEETIRNLIEKLQKENEELRKLTEFQKEYRNKLEQDLFENCSNFVVPKDKIRKKIEELENGEQCYYEFSTVDLVDLLKILLEEE